MAEELEAGPAEHLPFEHLGLAVDAFGPPVVVRERERGGGGLDVEIETSGERVEIRQVSRACAGDPLQEPLLVRGVGDEQGGEGPDQAGQGFHLRA